MSVTKNELLNAVKEAYIFIKDLRDSVPDDIMDILTNNPGEDIEEHLKSLIEKSQE